MAIYNVNRPDGSTIPYNAKSMAEVTRRTLLCLAVVLCWFIGTERASAATVADALFFDDDVSAAIYDSRVTAPNGDGLAVPVVGTLIPTSGLVPCNGNEEATHCFNVSPAEPLEVPDYFVDATTITQPAGERVFQFPIGVYAGSVGWLEGTESGAQVLCGDYPVSDPKKYTIVVIMDDNRPTTPELTTVDDNAFYAVRLAGIIPPCPASAFAPEVAARSTLSVARRAGTLIRWGQTWRAWDAATIRRNGVVIKRKTWDTKRSTGPHSWSWYHDTLRRGRYTAQVCGKAAGQNQCRIVKRWRKR